MTANRSDSSRSFHSGNPQGHNGKSNTWYTPLEITRKLGVFDLDPCTNINAPYYHAKNNIKYDLGECGLSSEWKGRVWLNPPYGKGIGNWLDKLLDHGNGIALVFARCETLWAQKAMEYCDAVFFIKGRIHFLNHKGKKESSAANGSMFLIYGEENISSISSFKGKLFINNTDWRNL